MEEAFPSPCHYEKNFFHRTVTLLHRFAVTRDRDEALEAQIINRGGRWTG